MCMIDDWSWVDEIDDEETIIDWEATEDWEDTNEVA